MYCNYCGKQLDEKDVFCGQCGNKVEFEDLSEPIINQNNDINFESVTEDSEEILCHMDNGNEENLSFDEREVSEECVSDAIENSEVMDSYNEQPEDIEVLDEMTDFVETVREAETDESENESIADQASDMNLEENEVVKKKRKKLAKIHKRSIGAHFGAFALSLLLSVLMIVTLAIFVVRSSITENSIKEMFSSIKLAEITIDSRADKNQLEELGIKCISDNVLDIIYDNINQEALREPLSKEKFDEIINNTAVPAYLGDLLGSKLESIVNGESVSIITADDIIDFVEKEESSVEDILGYELTEEHKNNLRVTLESNFGDVFETLEIKQLDSLVGKVPALIINVVFSDWLFIGLIVICALLIILIFLVLRSFRLGLLYNGITIMIVNSIYLSSALLLMFGILGVFVSGINAGLLTQVVSVILWDLVIITFSAVFLGMVMIAVSKIIKKHLVKNRS